MNDHPLTDDQWIFELIKQHRPDAEPKDKLMIGLALVRMGALFLLTNGVPHLDTRRIMLESLEFVAKALAAGRRDPLWQADRKGETP